MDKTITRINAPVLAPADSSKHVRYSFGMVLGVDDFEQEYAYLSERDRWLARDLIGYGTVWGLSVVMGADDQKRTRVEVDRGVAVDPCGKLVCVPAAQCAYIEPWLSKNDDALRAVLEEQDGGKADIPVYVVLCAKENATDDVPIPGEPCRSEDELTAPSRWQDDFGLELRLEPPPQREEDDTRAFCAWLRSIEIVDGAGSPDDFRAAVRAWGAKWVIAPETGGAPQPDKAAPHGAGKRPARKKPRRKKARRNRKSAFPYLKSPTISEWLSASGPPRFDPKFDWTLGAAPNVNLTPAPAACYWPNSACPSCWRTRASAQSCSRKARSW